MPSKEIPYDHPLPRQKVWNPTSGKWDDLTVPDCSHLHGFGQFMYPVVADPCDLPSDDPGDADKKNRQGY
jgi:hypothetical protein